MDENQKKWNVLFKAAAEGKVIQWKNLHGNWADTHSDIYIWIRNGCKPEVLRVKPEPEYIPLGPKDVPSGSVIRGSGETGHEGWCLITSVSFTGIRTWHHCDPDNQSETTWKNLMDFETQIKRPGEDWQYCKKVKK